MVVVRLSTVCSHSAAPRQKQNNSCVRTYTCLQTATGSGGRRCPPVEGIPKSKLNLRGSIFPGAALPRATKLALNEMMHSSALFERKNLRIGLEAVHGWKCPAPLSMVCQPLANGP